MKWFYTSLPQSGVIEYAHVTAADYSESPGWFVWKCDEKGGRREVAGPFKSYDQALERLEELEGKRPAGVVGGLLRASRRLTGS